MDNLLLMESISEIQQIVAECNTELIVIEASEGSEEKKEDKKKTTIGEKIKKMWAAFKNFVSKWWNRFIDMIKRNKAVIFNGKKEIEYIDFTDYTKNVIEEIKSTKASGHMQYGGYEDAKKATGKLKEAVKSLEKNASTLKKAIDSAKPEKDEKEVEDVNKIIQFGQSTLTRIQSELKRVISQAGGKTESKETVSESFTSVLDKDEDELMFESYMDEIMLEGFNIGEKIKKMWKAFKEFVSKWWNKIVYMIKRNKAVILNGKKEVTYRNYDSLVKMMKEVFSEFKISNKGISASKEKLKELMEKIESTGGSEFKSKLVTKGTIKEAVKSLEKNSSEINKLIKTYDVTDIFSGIEAAPFDADDDYTMSEKSQEQGEYSGVLITFITTAKMVLSIVQKDLSAVISQAGGKTDEKTESKETVDESFTSVLDDYEDDYMFESLLDNEYGCEDSFMSEASEIFYENVTMPSHEEYVASALEVYEIMSEADLMLESDSESNKEKTTFGEKIKKAWNAFIGFFKKWWGKFTSLLKSIKKAITSSLNYIKKEIEYKDYSVVIKAYSSEYIALMMNGDSSDGLSEKLKGISNNVVTRTATVSKAITILGKQGDQVKGLISKLDSKMNVLVKTNVPQPGVAKMIDSLYSLLSKIQFEADRCAKSVGKKTSKVKTGV